MSFRPEEQHEREAGDTGWLIEKGGAITHSTQICNNRRNFVRSERQPSAHADFVFVVQGTLRTQTPKLHNVMFAEGANRVRSRSTDSKTVTDPKAIQWAAREFHVVAWFAQL